MPVETKVPWRRGRWDDKGLGRPPALPLDWEAMRILVLGGTSFVGRAIVEEALRTGAEVTVFGRGRTGTDLFPGVPRLIGDRDTGDYAALSGGRWDAVADVSGYVPRHVGQAMDALGDRVGRYLFISSHAVYRHEGLTPGSTRTLPAVRRSGIPRNSTMSPTARSRSPVKTTCWRGTVPGPPQVEIVPVPPETAPPLFSLVRPYWPSQQRSPARARAAGMPATPLAVTVADVLAWDRSRGEPPLSGGLSPEQEQAVLAHQSPEQEQAVLARQAP